MTPLLSLVHRDIISCTRCPRLRSYCSRVAREKKAAHRDDTYWGRPVPGFGDPRARVLVLGLAPAAHGANRTGRVFTGDGSGDFLMAAMHAAGFASIAASRHPEDGLALHDAYITATVRCAPPDNKPTPAEVTACEPHLDAEFEALRDVQVIVALGRIAFDAAYRLLARHGTIVTPRPAFVHGALYAHAAPSTRSGRAPSVVASYHPSRQNTNTGKLTPEMLRDVFGTAKQAVRSRDRAIG